MAPLVVTAALAGCEAVIGADFDVEPLPGATGGAATSSSSSTTSSAASSGGGEGGSGGGSAGGGGAGAGECPRDADVIVDLDRFPWGITVDATHVYWSSPTHDPSDPAGAIRRAPKNGGVVETLADEEAEPNRVIVAGDHVYWTSTGHPAGEGALRFARRTPEGEPLEPSHDGATGLDTPIGLATHAGQVYFVNREPATGQDEPSPSMRVERVPIGELETQRVVHGHVPRAPVLLAADANGVFGASTGPDASIWRLDHEIDEGPLEAVVLREAEASPDAALALGEGFVVVTSQTTGRVDRYNAFGDVLPLATGMSQPADVRYAAGWFYFAEYAGGRIRRVRADGGQVECVVEGQPNVNGLAVDGERLYFTLHEREGSVRSVALPP